MVVRMRHTSSQRKRNRSHHALGATRFSICAKCSSKVLPHTACLNCGNYKGREVVDVLKKLTKKEKKAKEKELADSKSG